MEHLDRVARDNGRLRPNQDVAQISTVIPHDMCRRWVREPRARSVTGDRAALVQDRAAGGHELPRIARLPRVNTVAPRPV